MKNRKTYIHNFKPNFYDYIYFKLSRLGLYLDKINNVNNFHIITFPCLILFMIEILFISDINSIIDGEFKVDIIKYVRINNKDLSSFLYFLIFIVNLLYFMHKKRWYEINSYYNNKYRKKTEEKNFWDVVITIFLILLIFSMFFVSAFVIRNKYYFSD